MCVCIYIYSLCFPFSPFSFVSPFFLRLYIRLLPHFAILFEKTETRQRQRQERSNLNRFLRRAGFFPRLTQHSEDDGIKGSSIIRPPNHSTLRLENPRILFSFLPNLPFPLALPSLSPASLSLSPNPYEFLLSAQPLYTLTTSSSLTYTMFRVFFPGAHLLLYLIPFGLLQLPSPHPVTTLLLLGPM